MTTEELVKQRGEKYGDPRENFERAVGMINALFDGYLCRPLPADAIPKIMIILKLARSMHAYEPDNMRDIQGYAKTHEMLF